MEQASDKQVIESQKKIINQLTLEKTAIITEAKKNEQIVNIQGNLIKELRQQIAEADDRRGYEVEQAKQAEQEEAREYFQNVMDQYEILEGAFLALEKENNAYREMLDNMAVKLEKANKTITQNDEMHQEQVTDLEKYLEKDYSDRINEMNSFYKEKLEVAKRALESNRKTAKKALKNIEWKDKISFKTDNIKLHF